MFFQNFITFVVLIYNKHGTISNRFSYWWSDIAAYIYKDASQRGMNAIVWAIFGFLFGLITLIIYMIVRKPKQS